jgi:oleandomycin transport system permease protein
MRGFYLGGPIAMPVPHALAWAVGIAVVFAPLAVRRYRRIA